VLLVTGQAYHGTYKANLLIVE